MTPEEFADRYTRILDEIAKVIVGQRELVATTLRGVFCEGHVLLEGVPGLGKTTLLETLGRVLSVEFGRIQFTPDLMPADILGTNMLVDGRFEFHRGPVFANLVLADEINRATPKTQSALLEAMQERKVTLGGATHPLPRPFFVMATQNPIEMEGTYPLPEAQLDRFLFKALVPSPSVAELVEILDKTTGTTETVVEPVVDGPTLQAMASEARAVPIATHLLAYASRLVAATHPDDPGAPPEVRKYVRYGSSPRGAQAIVLGAKVEALLAGRPNVATEDVRAVAHASLRHRLVLGYEALADGVAPDELVDAVLAAHPAPTAD
ncbi:MAG TPA: AAA family ATPase [Actinobacteria bacterium]|nr:AAA family ATPase [Actinomycetota bacterium]